MASYLHCSSHRQTQSFHLPFFFNTWEQKTVLGQLNLQERTRWPWKWLDEDLVSSKDISLREFLNSFGNARQLTHMNDSLQETHEHPILSPDNKLIRYSSFRVTRDLLTGSVWFIFISRVWHLLCDHVGTKKMSLRPQRSLPIWSHCDQIDASLKSSIVNLLEKFGA